MTAPAAKISAGDLTALPEDALLEVLSRVRCVKDLFRFAVTSTWWLGLFTDPAFLRSMDFYALLKTGLLFRICNPATGERHIAPPVEGTSYSCNVTGYAIVTAADLDGEWRPLTSRRHEFSQLLLISSFGSDWPRTFKQPITPFKDDHDLHLHSYCAATRRWSEPTVCQTFREHRTSGALMTSAAVHRDTVHWLYVNGTTMAQEELCTLSVKMATMHVSFTKVPVTFGQTPFLCINREGKLAITSVYGTYVQVWTQQDGDDGDPTSATWLRTRLIQIPIAVPSQHPPGSLKRREWFEFNGGAMLMLCEGGDVFIIILDLEKKLTLSSSALLIGAQLLARP
ncbi:hypothetical protein EJB05_42610, partial [Eragrostis curvula]